MQKLLRWNRKILFLFVIILIGIFVFISVNHLHTADERINTRKLNYKKYNLFFQDLEQQNYTRTIINVADSIKRNAGFILLAIINDAFFSMTNSWLCNTRPLGIHKHVLFITTDKKSQKMMKWYWPGISSVYISTLDLHGDQEYSKVGYLKMMHLRTQIIRVLIEHGYTLLLFETDCLWIQNPLPDVESHLNNSDIVVVKPTHKHGYLGGFQLLKSTKNTLQFYKVFSLKMWNLYNHISSYSSTKKIVDYENDQVYFSRLLENGFSYLKISILSPEKYIDGKWYIDFTEEKRKKLNPYIINNNWVRGNHAKIERAKKWGHWFLQNDNSCNETQVKKIVKL